MKDFCLDFADTLLMQKEGWTREHVPSYDKYHATESKLTADGFHSGNTATD